MRPRQVMPRRFEAAKEGALPEGASFNEAAASNAAEIPAAVRVMPPEGVTMLQ